jgi:uncharacterized metal-binding protein
MPSGKTHDAVTFFLAVPVGILIWRFSGGIVPATIASGAFILGGLMFGPDLDTKSVQYARWGVFKIIWFPYRLFFPHRSAWTHGLLFGTLFRIIYFLGFVTVLLFGVYLIISFVTIGQIPSEVSFAAAWQQFGEQMRRMLGEYVFYFVFAGLWIGAASHSLADWALSYIKTGRR